jgi:hypothetical protein
MKINRNHLKRIIVEEIRTLNEGCGCGGGGCASCGAGAQDDEDDYAISNIHDEADDRLLSKDDVLNVVLVLAQNTSCPVTRAALMNVVDELSHSEGDDWADSSDDAFGAGVDAGTRDREDFSYTGDLPSDPSDAGELGYQTAMMGLHDDEHG